VHLLHTGEDFVDVVIRVIEGGEPGAEPCVHPLRGRAVVLGHFLEEPYDEQRAAVPGELLVERNVAAEGLGVTI
jgi:hypothetical protein